MILGFLVYAAVLAVALSVESSVRNPVILLNLAVLAAYSLLVHLDRRKPRLALSVTRDAVTQILVVLAYREMGWFAQPHLDHALETAWMTWDRAVLRRGGKSVIEALGPVLPSILEISYGLVYTLAPFGVAMLYMYRRHERVDQFLFLFTLAVLLCYGQFPFWHSDPPRVLFPGEDLPFYNTIFRRFNLWMLGNLWNPHQRVSKCACGRSICGGLRRVPRAERPQMARPIPVDDGRSDCYRHGIRPLSLPGGCRSGICGCPRCSRVL